MVSLRIPRDLLAVIDAKIVSCNKTRREDPYTRSSFIVASLQERFAKYIRAWEAQQRKLAAKRAAAEQPGPAVEQPADLVAEQPQS